MCEKSEQICEHTPGEWEAWQAPDGRWTVRTTYNDDMGRRYTAWPAVCCAGGQPNEANAHLFSAAKVMLAELKAVREQCLFDDDDGIGVSEDVVIPGDMFDRICAVINKAEGWS